MDDIVATSDRIYRLILNVYPRAFRDEYGEEIAQAMRDQVRDAWAERRVVGVTALWLKVLLDTARSAFTEHLKEGRGMSFSRRGLGYGLATAIGFPLALVSYLDLAGELVGFEQAKNGLHPSFAGPGFVLAGMGLYELHQRLGSTSTDSKALTIRAVWFGVALGLAGIAGMYAPTESDFFAGFTVPAAFVSITFGLANMGRIALREKTFGVFSFVPLAVAASAGVWFLSLFPGVFGGYRDVAQPSTLVVHVTLWFILGAVLWADPPGNTHPVRTAEEEKQIN